MAQHADDYCTHRMFDFGRVYDMRPLYGDWYAELDNVTRCCVNEDSTQDDSGESYRHDLQWRGPGCLGDKSGMLQLQQKVPLLVSMSDPAPALPLNSFCPTFMLLQAGSAKAVAEKVSSFLQTCCSSESECKLEEKKTGRFSITASIFQEFYGYSLRCTLKTKVVSAPTGCGGEDIVAVEISRRNGDAVAFGRVLASLRRALLDTFPSATASVSTDSHCDFPAAGYPRLQVPGDCPEPLLNMLNGPSAEQVEEARLALADLADVNPAAAAAYAAWLADRPGLPEL